MRKKSATTKQAAFSAASQQHEPVQEFLNQEPIRSHLLSLLREKTGNYLELKLLLELLESKQPISGNDLQKVSKHKGAISGSSKKLGNFLEDVFSVSVEPLKAKHINIRIPRPPQGGLNVGYHFICFDTKINEYLDGPATKRLFENLWDDFIRNELHRKLTKEAQDGLKEKLGGRDDYQVLDIEVGTIRQASQHTELDELDELEESGRPKIYDHNRTWEFTDVDFLFKQSSSFYVLSADAGCGKTTFLRYLQTQLLKDGKFIPIFIDASRLEKWNEENNSGFVERLAEYVNLPIPADRIKSFLERFLKEDIVLLIDGLDQIKDGGSEYEFLADHVLSLMGKNVIMASRPSAVINLENDPKYIFLKMWAFDTKTQKEYFGNTFGRARQLSQKAPHLIAIPMLANMVRMLIEDKQDKGINSRTELYERFVDHIFMEYKHGKTKLPPDERTQKRRSLRKVAYDALTQNKPNIQIIPLDFCYDGIHFAGARHGEFLAKSGLVNLVVDCSDGKNKDSLFFTHQSFQEYLAAEYVAEDDSRIQKVLSEKWNPKWKEVLKFLAGFKGEAIIKAIYSEQDNMIHSKLFLSAELVPDVNFISCDLKNGIWQDIETLLSDPLFAQDAEKYLLYADQTRAINRIAAKLDDKDIDTVNATIETLVEMKEKIDNTIISRIAIKLDNRNTQETALRAIEELIDQIDEPIIIKKVIAKLEDEDEDFASKVVPGALDEMKDKIDASLINMISSKLQHEDKNVVYAALRALEKLAEKGGKEIVDAVAAKLSDTDEKIVIAAIEALGAMKDKVDAPIITKMVFKFANKAFYAQATATVLNELKVDEDVAKTFVQTMRSDDIEIRIGAFTKLREQMGDEVLKNIYTKAKTEIRVATAVIHVFAEMVDKLDKNIIKAISCHLGHQDESWLVEAAIRTLGKLRNKAGKKITQKIAAKLNDESNVIVRAAIESLGKFDVNDQDIINNITAKLKDDDIEVVAIAFGFLYVMGDKIDTSIIEKITAELKHDNYHIGDMARNFLVARKEKVNRKIIEQIIAIIQNSEEHDIRVNAKRTLMELGEDVTDDYIIKEIAAKLESENDNSVLNSLFILRAFNEKINASIVEKIATCLKHENPQIVREALWTLTGWNDKIDKHILAEIVAKLEQENEDIIISALCTLKSLKEHLNDDIAKKIAAKLERKNTVIVDWALEILAQSESLVDNGIITKIAALLQNNDIEIAETALNAIVDLKDKIDTQIIEKIILMLENSDTDFASKVVPGALDEMKDKIDASLINMISSKLQHEDKNVVYAALRTLEKLAEKGGKEIVDAVAAKLSDTDEKIVIAAIEALGAMKDKVDAHKNRANIIKEISHKLHNRNKNVVLAAICALEKYADKSDADIVINMVGKLKDPNEQIVREAIDALGKMQNKIDRATVNKLTEMRIASAYQVLKDLYRNGRLEHLTN